jgi:uncharacterized protein with ParB-like and HNH nuclease domain
MDKLILKPINDLLGYRWKKQQVHNLLDDIWNFRLNSQEESKDVFYCLQPVVVSRKEDCWELIDGQQRLTTILIIMQCLIKQMDALDKSKYSISYETRPGSQEFLDKLSSDSLEHRDSNVDYFHICEAYEAVNEWFSGKDGNTKIHFLTTLLNDDVSGKNVKVIWYDVTEENNTSHSAIDIFTRLNIGKIPLTNAELIKALFLMKSNFEEQFTLKQLQIASEWDAMEKKLQDESFWYFIYNPKVSVHYDNRIEYIFDLLKRKHKDHEEYYTFNEFLKDLNIKEGKRPNIDAIWLSVKEYFLRLEEWYNDRELYHLLGFLIECGENINTLIDTSKTSSKTAFVLHLKKLIENQMPKTDLDSLNFHDHKKAIKKVLLLFNIQTILETQKAEMRFPFNKYKEEKWDIEHVNSQTEKNITHNNRKQWALDILEYFTGLNGFGNNVGDDGTKTEAELQKEFVAESIENELHKSYCERLINILEAEKYDEAEFDSLYESIKAEFQEDEIKDNDGISNLALLDESTNRSYGNAMFPIKRNRIIQNDMKGVFVPICTKNLFLKYYSKQMKDVMYWKKTDAHDYLSAIKRVLNEYLVKPKIV